MIADEPDYRDLILIDTPPAPGCLSLAQPVASSQVIIPVEGHALALPGVTSVIGSIDRAWRHVNPRLKLRASWRAESAGPATRGQS